MKITVVGAGAVGATCAQNIASKGFVEEVVLLDIKEGFAEGKTMDLMQAGVFSTSKTKIIGSTNDYTKTAQSKVVVITSGIPRKPGMTREALIGINAAIVKEVTENILKYSPNTIFVIISNPMDTMTYLALKESGVSKNRVIGMGGELDQARFKYYLSQEGNYHPSELDQCFVIGGHGDTTMIPLIRLATHAGKPIINSLGADRMKKIAADTMIGGATLTGLLGTSAWYAPGAAASRVVETIIGNKKIQLTSSVYLEGEYGQKDICLGVPVIIGDQGWEKIIDLKLSPEEQNTFNKSAEAVRSMNKVLSDMSLV